MRSRNYFSDNRLLLCVLALCISVVGCEDNLVAGIDGGGAPGAPSATVGAITGFGSVIVNGKVFNTSGSSITIDGNPGNETDLRLGQIVLIEFDAAAGNLVADSLATRDVVEGRVESVDTVGATLSVLGQSVKIFGDTVFDGATLVDSTGLSPGMLVEVSGYSLSTGGIAASRIEDKADSDEFEVTGVLENVDTMARTFQINALQVNYANATLINISADVANGDVVEIKGDQIDNAGVALAMSVERLEGTFSGDFDSVEIEGLITRFVSETDFDVQGVAVTTNAATQYSNGSTTDLGLNVKVEVEGAVDGSGVLVAESVEFRAVNNAKIEAFVSAVDAGQNTLQLLSISIDPSAATSFKDEGPLQLRNFSLSDINVGDFLVVSGEENVDRISATFIKRKSPEDKLKLQATATNLSEPQFEVLGVTIVTDSNTDFEDAGLPIDAATFFSIADGREVELEGDEVAGSILAAEVELEN